VFGFNSSTTDESGQDDTEATKRVPRRRFMQAAAGSGALLLGAGTASANGKGGQAIIREDKFFPDEEFVIIEAQGCDNPTSYGSCREGSLPYQCEGLGGPFPPGKGGTIPFPWWTMKYTSGPEAGNEYKLYTRDNTIKTGLTYRWTRKGKTCSETDGVVQVGFAPAKK
jgi:hypothetical protein